MAWCLTILLLFVYTAVLVQDHLAKNPGPGYYNPDRQTEANSVHSSAPAVSISHRHPEPHSQDRKPAPGKQMLLFEHQSTNGLLKSLADLSSDWPGGMCVIMVYAQLVQAASGYVCCVEAAR